MPLLSTRTAGSARRRHGIECSVWSSYALASRASRFSGFCQFWTLSSYTSYPDGKRFGDTKGSVNWNSSTQKEIWIYIPSSFVNFNLHQFQFIHRFEISIYTNFKHEFQHRLVQISIYMTVHFNLISIYRLVQISIQKCLILLDWARGADPRPKFFFVNARSSHRFGSKFLIWRTRFWSPNFVPWWRSPSFSCELLFTWGRPGWDLLGVLSIFCFLLWRDLIFVVT